MTSSAASEHSGAASEAFFQRSFFRGGEASGSYQVNHLSQKLSEYGVHITLLRQQLHAALPGSKSLLSAVRSTSSE